jgi:hypothetical protein
MRDAKIHSTAQPVDGGEEAREAASMRWKAIEGFNTAPDLSPVARRLGIALVCSMDSKSRACFPSEIRLAALLDVHPSAVKKAKAELKKAGLTNWHNPGGPATPLPLRLRLEGASTAFYRCQGTCGSCCYPPCLPAEEQADEVIQRCRYEHLGAIHRYPCRYQWN